MRKKFSLAYLIGVGCILWGLCCHFAFFQFDTSKVTSNREGIFVDAFLLFGDKSAFFLWLFFLFGPVYCLSNGRRWYLLYMISLFGLFSLMCYWTNEIKTVLQYASTDGMCLKMGSGYWIVCLGFGIIFIRLWIEFRRF